MLALLCSVVAAIAVWATAWYQPLSGGSGAYAAGVMVGDGYESDYVENVFGTEYHIVDPGDGDEIGMLFTLTNSGPFGVTVVKVEQPFSDREVSTALGVDYSAGRAERSVDETGLHWVPLAPFSIPSGGHAEIRLRFNAADCAYCLHLSPGAGTTADSVPVTIRELGISRTELVPLGYALCIGASAAR